MRDEFAGYAPILDVPGVAHLLHVSIEEVRRLHGEGWLAGEVVGNRVLFRRDAVVAWLKEQRIDPEGPQVVS